MATNAPTEWEAYLRSDGRKGIRNVVAVAYLVECAHHVARHIATPYAERGAQVIGFPGCYPNEYAFEMLSSLCTHPNVGAVLFVSLGCESMPRQALEAVVAESGRPVETLVIQQNGGTRSTVEAGRAWVEEQLAALAATPRTTMSVDELIVGAVCGGSDGTSGLTGNPAVGRAFDLLVGEGAACIFEETLEMIGCEDDLAARAVTPELGVALRESIKKAARYSIAMGYPSFAAGNATGGLTTIEEKSLGAYSKSGRGPVHGLIKPCDVPSRGGLYLLDVVPDGEARWGFPNINDNQEIAELISCGAHAILFITGRGSVVGSALSPVVKVCANPETYARMSEDMDVDAGRILEDRATLDEVGAEVRALTLEVAAGRQTASEALGHQEFVLGYKSFEPVGPACHPGFEMRTRLSVAAAR
jgi:altronate dehydratase large subunit